MCEQQKIITVKKNCMREISVIDFSRKNKNVKSVVGELYFLSMYNSLRNFITKCHVPRITAF